MTLVIFETAYYNKDIEKGVDSHAQNERSLPTQRNAPQRNATP